MVKYRVYLPFLLFMLFCVSAGFADTDTVADAIADADTEAEEEIEVEKGDFWLCPSVETALYSYSGVSYGGGFAFGYGKGSSIGMKAVWFFNRNGVNVLEVNFLYRAYFFGRHSYSGAFIQFMGGPVLFFGGEEGVSIPSKVGAFSLGVSLGWRFLIKDRLFIEPAIRGGSPYLAGAGLSAGIRF
jgi:hypothetical protein